MKRLIVAVLLLAVLAAAPPRDAAPAAATDVFPAIPEIRAEHGVAHVELAAINDPVSGEPAFEYRGLAGVVPTIRLRPGETIDLTLRNDMHAAYGRPDDVNVHFHGLVIPPAPPGDDVLGTLARPGQVLHYRVTIPVDHEPGLYWYHPHAHGETYYSVTNGMSGAIIVEGLHEHLPALRTMRERVIVLRDVPTGPGFVDADMPIVPVPGTSTPAPVKRATAGGPPCRAEPGLQPTLNRLTRPRIGIRPGERQLFRVVNASAARYFDLSVDDAMLELVARDGVPLDAYPGTPASLRVRHIVLPPAARAEFVVTAPAHATVLRSACFDAGPDGDAHPAVVLADLAEPPVSDASGPAASGDASLPLRAQGALPDNVMSRPMPRPVMKRTIRFSEDDRGFYIDGKAFSMAAMTAAPAITARSGTVEEWTIANDSDEVHDFHIHQVHFVTTAIDGAAVAPRVWSDTVNVPRRYRAHDGRSVPGTARLLVDFRDPIVRGTFVYHCHILDHEDQGMMATIRVR